MVTCVFFSDLSDFVLNNGQYLVFKTFVNDYLSCLFLEYLERLRNQAQVI